MEQKTVWKIFFLYLVPLFIAIWQKGKHGNYMFDKPMFLYFSWLLGLMLFYFINNEGKAQSPHAIFNNKAIPICDNPIRAGDYLIYSDGVRASSLFLYWKLKTITIVVFNPADKVFKKGTKIDNNGKTIVLEQDKVIKGSNLVKRLGDQYCNPHILRKIEYDRLKPEIQQKILSHKLNKDNIWIGYYTGIFEFKNPDVTAIELEVEEVSQMNTSLRSYLTRSTGDAEAIVSFASRIAPRKTKSLWDRMGLLKDSKEGNDNEE